MTRRSRDRPPRRPALGIDVGDKDRAAIAAGVSGLPAATCTPYLRTHDFRGNVTGPMFIRLPAMFMARYAELWNAVAPIAERIRSPGHAAPGSCAQFGKLATVSDPPATPPTAPAMVRILVGMADDQPIAAVLAQRLDVYEKAARRLRSLLEE